MAPLLMGGEEIAPFSDPIQLENYLEHIIALWNETRSQLLEGNWQWQLATCWMRQKS